MTANEATTHGSQAEFAQFMDTSGTQVGRWKKAGRLVHAADGKVDFAASKARIEETTTAPERMGIFSGARAGTREEKDRLEIHRMRLDLDERAGQLTETKRVADAAATAGAVLRARAENMPYVLSPQLAAASGGDEERCRAILVAWVESFLEECSAAMAGIAAAVKVRK
jgi:hypothetical protein